MSFAASVSAATTWIVVSPAATAIGCSGPQDVGVTLPEKVPESA